MEQELFKTLINAGVGAIIAFLLLYGIYKLTNKFGLKFIEAQQDQVKAINRLSNTLEKSIEKDQTEHREMIIMLKVISEKLGRIETNGG